MANPIFPSQTPGIKQPTVHPIHNAQTRYWNPATQKWVLGIQSTVPADEMSLDYPVLNVLKAIYTELRLLNYQLSSSLNFQDDLDAIRHSDPDFDFDTAPNT